VPQSSPSSELRRIFAKTCIVVGQGRSYFFAYGVQCASHSGADCNCVWVGDRNRFWSADDGYGVRLFAGRTSATRPRTAASVDQLRLVYWAVRRVRCGFVRNCKGFTLACLCPNRHGAGAAGRRTFLLAAIIRGRSPLFARHPFPGIFLLKGSAVVGIETTLGFQALFRALP